MIPEKGAREGGPTTGYMSEGSFPERPPLGTPQWNSHSYLWAWPEGDWKGTLAKHPLGS